MKFLIIVGLLAISPSVIVLSNFESLEELKNWQIVDDVVMGGRSAGNFELTKNGYGRFYGSVSTENYGGFSSVRNILSTTKLNNRRLIRVRLKGDQKSYQLRLKNSRNDYHSYITTFSTSGKWETLEFDMADLYPSFRGRKLDMPNFNHNQIEEITFLIANKKNEEFELLLDWIEIE